MAVVTTGFFDGVHLGHRHVLETLVSSARERGEEALVVTFWPHPRTVLQQDARDFRLLTSLEEKKALLLGCGVDRVEVIPFTRAFASLTAEQYLALLREKYGATLVVMGYDNRIGCDGRTAASLAGGCSPGRLARDARSAPPNVSCVLAPQELVSVGPLPLPLAGGGQAPGTASSFQSGAVSSTRIRVVLTEGRVDDAAAMLGYDYRLHGVVVAGNRLGRTIGFPTANMQLYEPLKLVPGNGVYAVEVEVLGQKYRGMTNIGTRPTVGGTTRTIETHILDFDQDIYGLPLEIRFLRRIRSEVHFPSLDALRAQLEKDRIACQG